MHIALHRIAATAILALGFCSPSIAADRYVAPGGNDAANGMTPGTAWATLQKAADTVVPGDTVHVADGNYVGFDIRTVATAGAPITFVASGANVQITGDNSETPDGINIENAAYITIDGFISSGRGRAGIRAAVSNHITVRNCTCGNNARWGIFTGFVDDLRIENNETFGSIAEHGIYASNSGDRPVIRGNHSHDNHAAGIHMNGDESQGGDGTISDALVENNVIHGNGVAGGSAINMDGVVTSVVRNNLLYDNHASGISLFKIDGATGSSGNLVINNTIINASNGRWCINISGGSTGITLRNNILYNYHSFRGVISIDPSSTSGFTSDYNSLMDRFSTDQGDTVIDLTDWQAEGYDTHSFLATPTDHFFNPSNDFHLLPASPAIDAGTATGAPGTDIDGDGRPVGAGYDIGAYEAQLPNCDDGNIDAGEICGEPGLPTCSDPCTTCLGCICAPADPVCGDAIVCSSEECESNGDCGGGLVCEDCSCRNPSLCTSGIELERARLKARATPLFVKFSAEVVIPTPWIDVDPPANGVHFLVDSSTGAGAFDALLPGGAAWTVNGSGTTWKYTDRDGTISGVTRVILKDRSSVEDGRLRVAIKAKSDTSASLPDATAVRTSLVLGGTGECGALEWSAPGGPAPVCEGSTAALDCR